MSWFPRRDRRKPRGGPRHVRRLEAFRQRHLAIDEAALADDGRDWVKLWVPPWSGLDGPRPPTWLRRRMLATLADVHAAWHTRLLRHEAETGVPFDCMLWWTGRRTRDCQVVFAVGDERYRYRGVFFAPRTDVPPRPPATDLAASERLAALTWMPGVDYESTTQGDLDEDPLWHRRFEARYRHRLVHHVGDGPDEELIWRTGPAWIGRLPGTTPA